MKNFNQWFKQRFPDEELPTSEIPAQWFAEHGIPMVVACTCCEMTMCAPSALIDEDNHTFCRSCGEALDPEEGDDEEN